MKLSVTVTLALLQLMPFLVNAKEAHRQTKKKNKKTKKENYGTESNSLVALVEGYGMENDGTIGTGTIRFNQDGSFLFTLDVVGLKNKGSVKITDSTSCTAVSETPFTFADAFDGVINAYDILTEGVSKSAFRFNSGYNRRANMGKTVLMYNDNNDIVACGVFGREELNKRLTASMGAYPTYSGTPDPYPFNPRGTVSVKFHDDDSFEFRYSLSGLAANCEKCGIHIHAGLSCDTHEQVLGHGWNSVVVQDLWTTEGGAFYNTNAFGNTDGYFELFNAFGYEENLNHAVVIHDQDGTRIGCGQLL